MGKTILDINGHISKVGIAKSTNDSLLKAATINKGIKKNNLLFDKIINNNKESKNSSVSGRPKKYWLMEVKCRKKKITLSSAIFRLNFL